MNRLLLVAMALLLCVFSMSAQAPTHDLALNIGVPPAAGPTPAAPSDGTAPAASTGGTATVGLAAESILPAPTPPEELFLQAGPPEPFSLEPLEEIDVAPPRDLSSFGNSQAGEVDGQDSTAPNQMRVKPHLLPDNMSWFERTMWGEDGVLRSTGIASPLTPEVRKSELGVRRTMLTMHQIGGFVTLGLMAGAVVYGQRYLNNLQRSDANSHQTFVTFTIISYGLTAALAALSPPPLIRRDEVSTTSIHKTLAWLHFAGMIVTPILGNMINRRGSDFYTRARYHQVAAYITTGLFTAAMVVMTF